VSDGLTLRVTLGLTDDLVRDLIAGSLDIAVTTTRPRHRGLHTEPLCDEEFVLVAAPVLARRIPTGTDLVRALAGLPPDQLRGRPADHPTVLAHGLPHPTRTHRGGRRARPPSRPRRVTAGAGISVLPRYLCADALADGRLVLLDDPDIPPLNTFYLATRANTRNAPPIAAIRDRLRAAADR
jgi:DNA-binding transcriptional LysR family regulator